LALIVPQTGRKSSRQFNYKPTARRKKKTKKEEKFWLRKREENQPEENGFSNRHVSTTFIPPLTQA
jgi:hypothetical protein